MNSDEGRDLLEKLEALLYHEKRDWIAALALLTDWERDLKREFLVTLNNALYAETDDDTDEVLEAAIAELSRPAEKVGRQ